MMKLHYSAVSPYVRKVMVVAHELELLDRIEIVRSPVQMITPNFALMKDNPIGKVPTLVLADGTALFDSTVICDYLDHLSGTPTLHPTHPDRRWRSMRWHILGVNMADIMLLWFRENLRPPEKRMKELHDIFELKLRASIPFLEQEAPALARTPFCIGQIAIACALDYLDLRFPHIAWRDGNTAISRWFASTISRTSFKLTDPRLAVVPPVTDGAVRQQAAQRAS